MAHQAGATCGRKVYPDWSYAVSLLRSISHSPRLILRQYSTLRVLTVHVDDRTLQSQKLPLLVQLNIFWSPDIVRAGAEKVLHSQKKE